MSDLETYLAAVEERDSIATNPGQMVDVSRWALEASQADVPTLEKMVFVLVQSANDYRLEDTLACVNRLAREAMEKRGG